MIAFFVVIAVLLFVFLLFFALLKPQKQSIEYNVRFIRAWDVIDDAEIAFFVELENYGVEDINGEYEVCIINAYGESIDLQPIDKKYLKNGWPIGRKIVWKCGWNFELPGDYSRFDAFPDLENFLDECPSRGPYCSLYVLVDDQLVYKQEVLNQFKRFLINLSKSPNLRKNDRVQSLIDRYLCFFEDLNYV